ncbi:MAG: hypothetical protein EXR79_12565 [Myxococcales bacterium]|nr:hypothetical protein [Myxococcales bacterium]
MTAPWAGAPRLLAITNASAWLEDRAAAGAFAAQLVHLCRLVQQRPTMRVDVLLRAQSATVEAAVAGVARSVAVARGTVGIGASLPADAGANPPGAVVALAAAGARFVQVPESGAQVLPAILAARDRHARHLGVGRSCHSAAGVAEALDAGADFVVLAPVHATPAKPGTAPLGVPAFAAIALPYPDRVIALGGIDGARAAELLRAGAAGVAAMRAAWTAEAAALLAACADPSA